MARNYPRNQTTTIFIICLILVLGTAFYMNGLPSAKSQVSYKNLSSKTQVIADIKNDEGDTKWQQAFFDEQKQVDLSKAENIAQKPATKSEPLTPTALLGRNFFTKYTELRRAGLTNDSSTVNAVANQIVNESASGLKKPNTYTVKDVKISYQPSDITATKNYAESLMAILKVWMPEKNEVEIVIFALENDEMEHLKTIDPIIKGYETALSRLLNTSVPSSFASYHLSLINGISMQIYNARALRNVDTDPLTGLSAISLEVKSLEMVAKALAQMQNQFTKEGITFVVPQSGSILQNR